MVNGVLRVEDLLVEDEVHTVLSGRDDLGGAVEVEIPSGGAAGCDALLRLFRSVQHPSLPIVLGPARAARIVAPFLALPFLLYPVLSALGAIARPFGAWRGVGLALAALGGLTAKALLADPASLATERNHPAWRGMYLLMLANQLAVAAVYVLG